MVDEAIPHDKYIDEMLAMNMSQIDEMIWPKLAMPFNLFGVSAIEIAEEIQTALAQEFTEDNIVDVLFDDPISLVEGASDFVGPPLSFDVLSGFVYHSDDVHDSSFMDLSIFEYLPVSYDITLSAPSSPTSHIYDIDDEITRHDLDDDSSFASNPDPIDQRVSSVVGEAEIIDFGIVDQPRKLRIRSYLSIDERDSLVQLLKSYLDVFAWSYEDMSGLDPSII
ncbi:hypothetical protein VitviT2T_002664 [Vitis vinifera]|uniref:Reverse transcriptase domain-containing protein n=1 Tax=Vitis vinifera TaxID=29760 RepID=A0ABY9BKE2_VITVI|nr:hypothetical protein VitviT2T_002664 [Vitis vinifera]